ncbi:MAG: D-amino acid aminotransferase [Gammaproteobacteria bacterium]|nr:MAG: D-amino acid aminotransferase [Gammaproteobacteria bacterium]
MSRIFYVNGEFVPEADARISVLDRGFLFADAVYEVSSVLDGKLIDNPAHLARLHRSLDELSMVPPASDAEIVAAQKKLVELNALEEGLLYLQVSRGVAERDFVFAPDMRSSVVMFTQQKSLVDSSLAERGCKVISVPDIRWQRRDIKTVALLAPSLAKQQAVDAGVDDAWMVEEGYVTEGTSNNAWIVTGDRRMQTRQLGHEILAGITRAAVMKFAAESGYEVVEEPFTIEEAKQAQEAFLTSASSFVTPVVSIDGCELGDGKPGPIVQELRRIYIEIARTRQEF